ARPIHVNNEGRPEIYDNECCSAGFNISMNERKKLLKVQNSSALNNLQITTSLNGKIQYIWSI
ncbi:MAG: hypothetical protein K2W79_00625, partial [Hydrotalea flava]|nr:hypothetical protein [Hydrotalea flava]